jgi:Domain of unknown function (DUF4388)
VIELKGSLRGVGLLPIVQLLADVRETGQLRVSRGELSGQLDFEDGHLVGVTYGEERGLGALAALASAFPEAEFTYLEGPPPTERNVDLTLDQLRQHLSRMGSSSETGNAVTSLRAVPRLLVSPNGSHERLELERGSLQLLLAIDGERNVAEIIGDMPLVAALRELGELMRLGLIRIDPPARPSASSAVTSVPSTPGASAASVPSTPDASVPLRPGPEVTPEPAPSGTTAGQPPLRTTPPTFRSTAATALAPEAAPVACPKLAFADEPNRRYSRPTGLHRCYASGIPDLVSPQEQRELCLSGAYASCTRLLESPNGANGSHATNGVAQIQAVARLFERPYAPAQRSRSVLSRAATEDEPDPDAPLPERLLFLARRLLWAGRLLAERFLPTRGLGISLGIGAAAAIVLILKPGPLAPRAPAPRPAVATPVGARSAGPNAQRAPTAAPQAAQPRATAAATNAPAANATTAPAGKPTAAPEANPTSAALANPSTASVANPTAGSTANPTPASATSPTPAAAEKSNPASPAKPTAASADNPTATLPGNPLAASRANPTETAGQPFFPGGRSLMDARFLDRPAGWLENPPFARWADGAYRLTSREPQRFVAVAAPISLHNEPDVIVSATFRKVGGPSGGGYGIIVRDQSPGTRDGVNQTGDYYVLEVGDRGEVGVWRRDGDRWVDLLPWTGAPAVRPGGSPNDLVVEAIGDRLIFVVNGVEVYNDDDLNLDSGGVGLFVGGDANEVALDHFSVQTPD